MKNNQPETMLPKINNLISDLNLNIVPTEDELKEISFSLNELKDLAKTDKAKQTTITEIITFKDENLLTKLFVLF